MKNVKLTESQKQKVAIFLSEQLHTLRTEKRIGRMYYDRCDDNFIKSLEEAIEVELQKKYGNDKRLTDEVQYRNTTDVNRRCLNQ